MTRAKKGASMARIGDSSPGSVESIVVQVVDAISIQDEDLIAMEVAKPRFDAACVLGTKLALGAFRFRVL